MSRAEWLRPRWWTLAALTLVGVFALGAASVHFSLAGSTVAPWWPAAGLAVCFLLATDPGPRRSFLFVLGVLVSSAAANVYGGRPTLVSLLYGTANAAEVAVVHGLLTARGRRPRLASMEDLWRLIAATVTGAVVIGLLAGLTAHFALGGNFLDSVSAAASSHGAAVLVMAPLGIAARGRRTRGPDLEDLVQWIVVVGVTFWVFHRGQSLPLVFLPIPGLVWGALRLGLRTVAVQLIVVGALTVRLTIIGGGPFAAAARHGGIRPETVGTLTQAFLVTAAVTTLSLAVAATQRRSALAELRAEGVLTAGVLDTAASVIIVVDRRGVIARLNATAARLLGGAEGDLVGRPAADVFPVADRPALAARMAAIADGAVPLAEEHDWDVPGLGVRHLVWTNAYLTDDDGHRSHLVKTGVDVTDERAARSFVEAVLEAATATVIVGADLDGVITLFNRGAENVLGYQATELVGRRDWLVLHDAEQIAGVARDLGIEPGFDVLVHRVRGGARRATGPTCARTGPIARCRSR